jgi:hypothetical protein
MPLCQRCRSVQIPTLRFAKGYVNCENCIRKKVPRKAPNATDAEARERREAMRVAKMPVQVAAVAVPSWRDLPWISMADYIVACPPALVSVLLREGAK